MVYFQTFQWTARRRRPDICRQEFQSQLAQLSEYERTRVLIHLQQDISPTPQFRPTAGARVGPKTLRRGNGTPGESQSSRGNKKEEKGAKPTVQAEPAEQQAEPMEQKSGIQGPCRGNYWNPRWNRLRKFLHFIFKNHFNFIQSFWCWSFNLKTLNFFLLEIKECLNNWNGVETLEPSFYSEAEWEKCLLNIISILVTRFSQKSLGSWPTG